MADVKRVLDVSNEKDEMFKAIDKMAELMKRELEENFDRKGGRKDWLKMDAMSHVLQVYYHNAKLQFAVKDLLLFRSDSDASRHELQHQEELVKEYAADCCNHALMTLDVLDLLGVPRPVVKVPSPPTYSSGGY